jgi:hypothetical protein
VLSKVVMCLAWSLADGMVWLARGIVVGRNPPTGIDRQHESQEAQILYPSALQLARALQLRFVGRAT